MLIITLKRSKCQDILGENSKEKKNRGHNCDMPRFQP